MLNSLYEVKPSISIAQKHTTYAQLRSQAHLPLQCVKNLIQRYWANIIFKSAPISIFERILLFFPLKKHYPTDMLVCASIIHKSDCYQQFYIGSTARHSFRRCAQHREVSLRTCHRLLRPDNSAFRDHRFINEHPFKISYFNVINSTPQHLDLSILEYIHIFIICPEIHSNQTATTVDILDMTQVLAL